MSEVTAFIEVVSRHHLACVMGIVNLTPDSFFDGGQYEALENARTGMERLVAEGADMLDLGAESTRPGAEPVSTADQLARLLPALEHALTLGVKVSIDTANPEVAKECLQAGAHLINDVSCLADDELARVVAEADASLIIMHSRGSMTQMAGFSDYPDTGYTDIMAEVDAEWQAARKRAEAAGLQRDRLLFDPGLGFHKNAKQSFELLSRLGEFKSLGVPVVLGASRKSFIGSVDGSAPEERLAGSLVAAVAGVERGARIVRVHDVAATMQALLTQRSLSPTRRRHA